MAERIAKGQSLIIPKSEPRKTRLNKTQHKLSKPKQHNNKLDELKIEDDYLQEIN